MNRLGISSVVALALAAAGLAGAPAASAKTSVIPAFRNATFVARGSGGWHLEVSASLSRSAKRPQRIGIYAGGPHNETVEYSGARGRGTESGRIKVRVPGLARVDVRFEQTSEEAVHVAPRKGCKLEGESAIRKGVFRGTIEFHGEGGYTTVERKSAPGEIIESPREVCRLQKHHRESPKRAERELANSAYLFAGGQAHGGELTFSASTEGGLGDLDPFTEFGVAFTHRRNGLTIVSRTTAVGDEGGFSLTAPNAMPSEATVEPPAPFSGSATFKLESPTTATWTGDLSVELATLGRVSLAEPGFWAAACKGSRCTKTFPPGVDIDLRNSSLRTSAPK